VRDREKHSASKPTAKESIILKTVFFRIMFGSSNAAAEELKIKGMFQAMDKDGSGKIEKKELHGMFKSFLPKTMIDTIVGYVDTSGDGKIDYKEFKAFMKKAKMAQKFM